jgi:CRP/FNR family transcriptional regulator, cyclic AMP receptor protein
MATPYNLDVHTDCLRCSARADRPFCNMSAEAVDALDAITFTSVYPKGSVLFAEGERPRGVFIICSGRVKLMTSSSEGKTLILRIAEPGEVLGLSSAVADRAYEVSAETLEPCQINAVRRDDFVRFITEHVEACMHSAEQLSSAYNSAQKEIRNLGLSQTTGERLARLLLDWSAKGEKRKDGVRLQVLLTHEEMAEMIGTTRETVTRLLSDLKKKGILEIKGATFIIKNPEALEAMVSI